MLVLYNSVRSSLMQSLRATLQYSTYNGSAYLQQLTRKNKQNALQKKYFIKIDHREMCLWGYVAIAFNKVDLDRQLQVGPDRLCAEWILKNGGAISFVGMGGKKLRDYNSLPPENTKLKIQIVDASNSSIMKIGLEHFNGCKYIDTVILHNCKHLEEDGLQGLIYLAKTLKTLHISGCYNLREKSLDFLPNLVNLEYLNISDLLYVKNLKAVAQKLQKHMPKCKIEIA